MIMLWRLYYTNALNLRNPMIDDIDLHTNKWYIARHIFEDNVYYNYFFEIDKDIIKYLAVSAEWDNIDYIEEDLPTFKEDIFHNYEMEMTNIKNLTHKMVGTAFKRR